MEYLQLGDLEEHLKSRLSHIEARQITRQLLEGLEFIHHKNFVHRDLKPSNILVLYSRPQWWVKIADFGITKKMDNTALRTIVGTEAYLAPEVRGIFTADIKEDNENTFSFAVDIWAVGAITFRMVTGRLVFPPGRKLFDYVICGQPFPMDDSMSPESAIFVVDTMAASPHHQPTSQEALSYLWIQTQDSVLTESDIFSITSADRSPTGTVETLDPIASAQWSALDKEFATLRVDTTTEGRLEKFGQLQKLEGHTDTVESVVFSPDGRWLASGSYDHTIRIWETDEQGRFQLVQALNGHRKSVRSVAFSPDGRQLASGAWDTMIRIWEPDNQGIFHQVQELEGHRSLVMSVAFSPDGRRLASGSYDHTIRIWAVDKRERFQQAQEIKGHRNAVQSVAFSPDGSQLATGGSDMAIWIWKENEQGRFQQVQVLEGFNQSIYSVAFSPDGHWLAGGDGSTIRICEIDKQGKFQQKFETKGSVVLRVTFSPNGLQLASGSNYEQAIRIWEVDRQGKLNQVQELKGHDKGACSAAFSPNGRLIASGSLDKTICIWGLDN